MRYSYRAIKNNTIESNVIDAESETVVIEYLKNRGYFPIEIKLRDSLEYTYLQRLFNRITFNDLVDFTRQLSIMLNAGLTLIESLDILKKQVTKVPLRNLIDDIGKKIRGGGTFSSALRNYPDYFSNLYIALVRAGEASGKLADVMKKLSENMEKERDFKGKLKGALIYPAIVVAGMISVIFIMITFVVPKLLDLYRDFSIDLPWNTKLLIVLSNFFVRFWVLVIPGVIGGAFLLRRYFKTKKGKMLLDSTLLKLPAFSNVIKMAALVDSTRTLAILVSSGVSILESMTIITETTSNVVYQNAFRNVYKEIERGSSIGTAFSLDPIFPPILVQMTIVGESTGHLDETLDRLSKYFQAES
ncbi:MAG: type II secretion system F family protein, partial [Patescibacteria group bacterium]